MTPGRLTLADRTDHYRGDVAVTAPAVGVVTRYEIEARNPRSAVAREVFVVPEGTLYVKAIQPARQVVIAGDTTPATLELSAAPTADVVVSLAASSTQVSVPATVTVAAGSTTAAFAIGGGAVEREVRFGSRPR